MNDYYEYKILSVFAPYIINNDPTALNDTEIAQIDSFLADMPENGINVEFMEGSENGFALCEVTRLYGATINCRIYIEGK